MAVCYLGQEVLRRRIQSNDLRVTYLPPTAVPPMPAVVSGRFPRLLLPDPPSTFPPNHDIFKLLPFMQGGVVLTSLTQGVYARRFCQGHVFWTGPHTGPRPQKLERNTNPVLLFSKDAFRRREAPPPPTLAPPPCPPPDLPSVLRTRPLPFHRRRPALLQRHAVLRRGDERGHVGESHRAEGEGREWRGL